MKVSIIGAGGFAKEVFSLCYSNNIEVNGFYVDYKEQNYLYGKPIIEGIYKSPSPTIIAIGSSKIRQKIVENYPHFKYINLIDYSVRDSGFVTYGRGCIVSNGTILTNDIKVGNHVTINKSCVIGHDAIIGDFCTISPGVNISGNAVIGKGVFIGSGAIILPSIKVGDGSIIGAGAVVDKYVNPNITVAGVPALRIK